MYEREYLGPPQCEESNRRFCYSRNLKDSHFNAMENENSPETEEDTQRLEGENTALEYWTTRYSSRRFAIWIHVICLFQKYVKHNYFTFSEKSIRQEHNWVGGAHTQKDRKCVTEDDKKMIVRYSLTCFTRIPEEEIRELRKEPVFEGVNAKKFPELWGRYWPFNWKKNTKVRNKIKQDK